MEKIKLNYGLAIYRELSFDEIAKIVFDFKKEKELELINSGNHKIFEVIVNVTMPLKSIDIK